MRGLLFQCELRVLKPRYNPAYAGTTKRASAESMVTAIQPRVCGDYKVPFIQPEGTADTTPRMRGLRFQPARPKHLFRYNPAYAGTTVENI